MPETRQGRFAVDLRAWCEKAKENADKVVRATALELLNRIVLRSPVGNPELWAANAEIMRRRASYNEDVERTNSLIDAHPELGLRYGKLKKQRALSPRTIAKRLPLKTGRNYVGGRFRGNWQVSIGAPASGETPGVDPGGGKTIASGSAVIGGAHAGVVIWIINNVPYSIELEYGHSKQAPNGMVRVTAEEFQAIVDEQVRAVNP